MNLSYKEVNACVANRECTNTLTKKAQDYAESQGFCFHAEISWFGELCHGIDREEREGGEREGERVGKREREEGERGRERERERERRERSSSFITTCHHIYILMCQYSSKYNAELLLLLHHV